jgi:hypothetical protein
LFFILVNRLTEINAFVFDSVALMQTKQMQLFLNKTFRIKRWSEYKNVHSKIKKKSCNEVKRTQANTNL